MRHRVLGAQQVAGKDLRVGGIKIAVVAAQVMLAPQRLEAGQAIPRHIGVHVVDGVEIVVQKQ